MAAVVIFGIIVAVCQVEVVVVGTATGLIVHFITKASNRTPFCATTEVETLQS